MPARSANAGGGATVERALSSLFASTSGRAEAAADRLSAIPARVRALINSKRLDDALLQLARIDARAELRSAVHSARATYQRRIASIQRELRKDHADLIRAQLAAPRLVALCNGLQYSSGGQVRGFAVRPCRCSLCACSCHHTGRQLARSVADSVLRGLNQTHVGGGCSADL